MKTGSSIRRKLINSMEGLFGVGIGLMILFGSFQGFFITISLLLNSELTTAQVLEINESKSRRSTSYSALVQFQLPNGQLQTFDTEGLLDSLYEVGQTIDVLYDPDDPSVAKVNRFRELWSGNVIFLLIGIVPFSGGLYILIKPILRKREIETLISSGMRIKADLLKIIRKKEKWKPEYYIIVCEAKVDDRMLTFESDPVDYNPKLQIQGQKISVYLNTLNHKKYYVNLPFLNS